METFIPIIIIVHLVAFALFVEIFIIRARSDDEKDQKPDFECRCGGSVGWNHSSDPFMRLSMYTDYLVISYMGINSPIVLKYSEIEELSFDEHGMMCEIRIKHSQKDLPKLRLWTEGEDRIQKMSRIIGEAKCFMK